MSTRLSFRFLKCFLLLLLALFFNQAYSQCPKLVWSDEFDGTTLNLNNWSYQTGNGCDLGSCGWGNNELQFYTNRNAIVSDGTLKITAKKERVKTNEYTSSRIRSIPSGNFKYGRMEARIKLPIGKGIWPAFWMMPTKEVYGEWPQSGEIDIMENRGSEPRVAHGTIHYGGVRPNNKYETGQYKIPNGQLNEDFHVYAIEWEETEIRWYIDGILYSVKTTEDIDPDYRWPFDQDFHFLLNVAVGGNYDGSPDASTAFPQSMVVDYVRVYDRGTPNIEGPDVVQTGTDVTYTVSSAGTAYNWSVPAGAVISGGQGTNSITVKWGEYQGQVKVAITQECGTVESSKLVYTDNIYRDLTFQNFEVEGEGMAFQSANGVYKPFLNNPAPSTINSSPKVGEYTRNSASQYDVLSYTVTQIKDASEYATGKKRLYMDVLTNAPVNTLVVVYLNNSAMSAGKPHPTGRHSYYTARTTKQNEWERLVFELGGILDTSVPNNSIDLYSVLFASETYTGDTYYIDNIDSYIVGVPVSGDDKEAPTAPISLTFANVTETSVDLSWKAATDNTGVTGYDIVRNGSLISSVAGTSTSYTDEGLTANTTYSYTVKAKDAASNVSAPSNTISVTTSASQPQEPQPGDNTSIKVEAESYIASRNVSVQPCSEGGFNLTSIDKRDFADYTVTIPAAGTYRVDFRVASHVASGAFDLKLGSTTLASVKVPNTTSGQIWTTVNQNVSLTAGTHTFKVVGTGSTSNLNWFSFTNTEAINATSTQLARETAVAASSPVTVYPNPTTGILNIRGKKLEVIESVEVISVTGAVKTFHPNRRRVTLTMTGEAKGLYMFRIKMGNQYIMEKVLVK